MPRDERPRATQRRSSLIHSVSDSSGAAITQSKISAAVRNGKAALDRDVGVPAVGLKHEDRQLVLVADPDLGHSEPAVDLDRRVGVVSVRRPRSPGREADRFAG